MLRSRLISRPVIGFTSLHRKQIPTCHGPANLIQLASSTSAMWLSYVVQHQRRQIRIPYLKDKLQHLWRLRSPASFRLYRQLTKQVVKAARLVKHVLTLFDSQSMAIAYRETFGASHAVTVTENVNETLSGYESFDTTMEATRRHL